MATLFIMPEASAAPLQSVLHLLHRAGQRADGLFARHVAVALTPRQFIILLTVADANGLRQADISAATGIDRSSITDLLKRLVANGWLQRRRSKRDARAYAVRLTPEGRRVLARGIPAASATEQALLSSIAPAERKTFVAALTVIATNPDGAIP